MKKFQMKTVQVEGIGEKASLEYESLITAILKSKGEGRGLDLDAIYKRCRVLEALDKAKGRVLLLEDQDAEVLLDCLREMKWAMVDVEIGRFCKALEEAMEEDISVEEVKPKPARKRAPRAKKSA